MDPPGLQLGYHGYNHALRRKHILTDRTARIGDDLDAEKRKAFISRLKDLYKANLEDLYKIIMWNVTHGIKLYRISSGIAPHITDPRLLPRASKLTDLAYDLRDQKVLLRRIGGLARQHNMSLTFHPGQFVVLSSPDTDIVHRSARELYYHALLLRLMGFGGPKDTPFNSVVIIHGGGVYGDKAAAMQRWIRNYKRLPALVRKFLVLENDEKSYSIEDVLAISKQTGVPIVLDVFHHYIMTGEQPGDDIIRRVVRTWAAAIPKMHISEQKRGAVRGAHAEHVRTLPDYLLQFSHKYGRPLDLMIEAGAHENAVAYLRKKYLEK